MRKLPWLTTCVAGLVLAGPMVVLPATAARAQFPGENGRIAFDRGVSGQFQIVSVSAGGRSLRVLASQASEPRYDASGSRIAYVAGQSSAGLRVMRADGTHKHRVTSNAADTEPTWSPTGRAIAFMRTTNLMAVQPDGSHVRRIRHFTTGTYTPNWSPSGARIAFTHYAADNQFHIFTIRPDGTGLAMVPHTAACGEPDWSPNGRRLVFTCTIGSSVSDIVTARADGTRRTRITSTTAVREFRPTWSPDGTRILYFIIENGALYTIRPDGTHRLHLRSTTGAAVASSWQPR